MPYRRLLLVVSLLGLGAAIFHAQRSLVEVRPVEPRPTRAAAATPPPRPRGFVPPQVPARDRRGTSLRISLAYCPGAGCDVILSFNQRMKETTGSEAAERDDALVPTPVDVRLDPAIEGRWVWDSPYRFRFVPSAQGALNWGQRLQVTVSAVTPLGESRSVLSAPWQGTLQVPFLQIAGKVASWPIVPGEPRLIAPLNWRSGRVGRGPVLLLYDQPVEIDRIRSGISVSDVDGERLAIEVSRPSSIRYVTSSGVDPSYLAAVRLVRLPAEGEPLFLSVEHRGLRYRERLTLDTEFHLVRHEFTSDDARERAFPKRADRVPLATTLALEFSDPVSLSVLEQAIRLEPRPLALTVYGYSSREARIALELAPGTRYRLSASEELVDVLGNSLEDPLDVRFRAEDLEPSLSLPVEALLVEKQKPEISVRARNVGTPVTRVFSFDSEVEFARALASKHRSRCSDYGLVGLGRKVEGERVAIDLNVTETFSRSLGDASGLLCVELEAPSRGSRAAGPVRDAVLVQSSNLGITTKTSKDSLLVWVTRLDDARSVAGAEVRVLTELGTVVAEGTTDAAGIAVLETPGVVSTTGLTAPLLVAAEIASEDASAERALARVSNDVLAQAWHFGLPGPVPGAERLDAAVFTERGVYRPGETVHTKVIAPGLRARAEVSIEVHDPLGQQVTEKTLSLDDLGTAAFELPLGEQAPVGEYALRVQNGAHLAERRFLVEEYRVPTFEVGVASEGLWDRESPVEAVVSARYHHGGGLAGREVQWRVVRSPQLFSPASFSGFVFHRTEGARDTTVARGEGKLDTDGRLAVEFTPGARAGFGPLRYTVDATVTDVDRQAYAGRLGRLVHPAAFYLGLRPPPQRVVVSGRTLVVPVVAVDTEGKALAGIDVELRVEEVAHHTAARLQGDGAGAKVQLVDHPVTMPLTECRRTTAATAVECELRIDEPGTYRITASARDAEARPVVTSFDLIAAGDSPAPWPRFSQETITVVTDRDHYRPGDVARLVVETPFETARGLLTVERDGILATRLIEIRRDTPAIELPITERYAPNVFVSVVLLRGRIHDERDAVGFETGAPAFRLGYASFSVVPVSRKLEVDVAASARAEPGETLPVHLCARDASGRPVRGQATLMVVDEAVLGLTSYRTPNPLAEIYASRPLGVRTAESRLELAFARRSRHEELFPGGDGGEGDVLTPLPEQLRNLFQSTAYWNPDVRLGEDGEALVEVPLPDNVTTFRVMAVVTDGEARVGSADQRVLVRKPLMVQPVLPRFVYPGDRLTLEALAFNGTEEAGEVMLEAELEGLRHIEPPVLDRRPVGGGESTSFPFAVEVTSRQSVRVRFRASLGAHRDSVEVTLPVLSPGTRRTVVESTTVTRADELSIEIPAERIPGTAEVELVASTTALSELEGAVDYLMHYPNGCIEQTTSTAYPLVTLKDLLPEIGVEVDPKKLEEFTRAGLDRILSFQTTAGGLSYWPGRNEPHAFATAFGLTALLEAKKQGYEIPEDALARMADYLEASLRQGKITGEMPHGGMADGDTRALFVMTLGRLGRPQPAYLETLWQKRSELTAFGLSFLAVAAREMDASHPLIAPILDAVHEQSREDEAEAWFEGERRGGWSFDSPLRTHASALLAYAEAGAGPTGGKLLQGLLHRQSGGMWGNTQENVFGIMGVHAITRSARTGAGPSMALTLAGTPVPEASMERPSSQVRRLRKTEESLGLRDGESRKVVARLERASGPPILLHLRAHYEVPLTPETRAPLSNGFVVHRSYEALDGSSFEGAEGTAVPLGSLVRVRLRVESNAQRNYVAIADKLPAGLEPLNARLDTTESVDSANLGPAVLTSLRFLSHTEMRDERVAFYVDDMPPGTYEFAYVARATTPGVFLRPAADVEAMYEPEVRATTLIDEVRVR